jgi:hypothetical protein
MISKSPDYLPCFRKKCPNLWIKSDQVTYIK